MIQLLLPAILAMVINNPINLTHQPTQEAFPSWSPDGTQISFLRYPDQSMPELYTMELATGSLTNISQNDDFESTAAWSPDGTQLVYSAYGLGDYTNLVIATASGEPDEIVVEFASGQRINGLVWSPAGDRIAFECDFDILVMAADGTQPRDLTGEQMTGYSPAWSPDGSKIAFFASFADNLAHGIYIANADGTNPTKISNQLVLQPFAGTLSWSPSGNQLVFAFASEDNSPEIAVINSDGSDYTVLTNDLAPSSQPSWSPDGNKIAFLRSSAIFVMNADGSGQRQLSPPGGYNSEPVWSPDGSAIAYLNSQLGQTELYRMGADGSDPTRVTDNRLLESGLAWSPDGKKFSFNAAPESGGDIYLASISGDPATPFITRTAASTPALWSPDGSKIAYVSAGNDIFVLDKAGNVLTHLVHRGATSLAWSPDGANLLFMSDDIYVVHADGTGLRALGVGSGEIWPLQQPVWSPDSSKIAFILSTKALADCRSYQIHLINVDGTALTQLTVDVTSNAAPTWSPDGSEIAYVRGWLDSCAEPTENLAEDLTQRAASSQNLQQGNPHLPALYIMKADGSNQRIIAESATAPVWSPSTEQIAFSRNNELYVINADGSNETNLTLDDGYDALPVWSPNGRHIAFVTTRDGNLEIYLTTVAK